MPVKLSVCVEMIFRDRPFVERLERVRAAGYDAYEFWRWDNKNLDEIEAAQKRLGLQPAGLAGAHGGALVDPAQRAGFLDGLRNSCAQARRLGAPVVIVTVGQAMAGVERARQHESIVHGLRQGAAMAADAGLTLTIEPLNTLVNHAGYYLDSTAEAIQIIREVDNQAVKLLYDIYHMQVMEGNLANTIRENVDLIAHLHVADCPGRHEPGTGEINYGFLFDLIASLGYRGFVGLEYVPSIDAAETLAAVAAMVRD